MSRRWVKVLAIVVVVLALLAVVMVVLASQGGHTPRRHGLAGSTQWNLR